MPIFIGRWEERRTLEAFKKEAGGFDYIMVHWGFSNHKRDDAVGSVEELEKKILEV